MVYPELKEFRKFFETGKRIPIFKEIPLGEETPFSALEKIHKEGEPVVLLESGKGTENLARYSFIGFKPWLIYKYKGKNIEITIIKEGREEKINRTGHPYEVLEQVLHDYPSVKYPGLPKFYGGAMGFISYDMGRYFEKLPSMAADDLATPEAYFMFVDRVICFDRFEQKIKIIFVAHKGEEKPGPGLDPAAEAYQEALDAIDEIILSLKYKPSSPPVEVRERALQNLYRPKANMTKEEFENMIVKAKEYIKAGDIFQVNLSIRLSQEIKSSPRNLYRVLREVNPSPYMAFIEFGDMQVVGCSPELLVKITGDLAETRPIAGTRRRGNNRDEDLALAQELINNEKERAEHIMLVDLERNDLGRVCKHGTVRVNELMVIEEYSHVMHIVSNVQGNLAGDKTSFDLLRAAFPGGTITGAPKIRSMEIIEELEPTRRGVYTGSVGFFGYGGEMEMNISIRTIVVKDGVAYVQAGAGIVADSIPEKEYYESLKKAEAMLRAIELAERLKEEGEVHSA